VIVVRPEAAEDEAAIREVNEAAFGGPEEASLVDRLRSACGGYASFVAVDEGAVVGHILFTPITLAGATPGGMGLAPMAVPPARQGQGIGSQMVEYGIARLRGAGCPFVVVLGHPEYYPRFGFDKASRWSMKSPWDGVPDEAFMLLPLDVDALPSGGGVVRYRPEFSEGG
jgi:putative acetyltransferase